MDKTKKAMLIGCKIKSANNDQIVLSNGVIIDYNVILFPKTPKTPKGNLTEFLRSLGFRNFWIDRRKDHFRIKCFQTPNPIQIRKIQHFNPSMIIEVLCGCTYHHGRDMYCLVIRTITNPSQIFKSN